MSHASLAARYRPQTFAEVTGQETVKAILSRAAAEDKVAPAYLLSGTRGVGKTTIARIFAKALNCVHAPTGEPCNQCEQCRRITMGNHVDVVEIDGASNRGIDDARRLREAIAYAPMEGRYKVFIIDEAHMLTRESFNALLKTLEEPPPRAAFILATTEAHKFPITIVSRCQHFIFKAIPEAELVAHLTRVLNKEGIPFEENAVRLLARRAAGSVRDSMSLLGQTLALGGDHLTEASTRSVLGLAGQELYERLLNALKAQDCLAVAALTQELLERGVDLGFFLRELTTLWRNLFLIRQAGAAATAALDMPDAEKQRLLDLAPQFDPAYIHAAWQMVLESQRQVLTSLEPSAALELLLLNLALLPRLVSLETLSRTTVAPASGTPAAPAPSAPAAPVSSPSAPAAAPVQPTFSGTQPPSAKPSQTSAIPPRPAPAASRTPVPPRPVAAPAAPARPAAPQGTPPWATAAPAPSEQSEPSATVAPTDAPHPLDTAPAKDAASARSKKKHASTVPAPSEAWMDFVEFCRKNQSDVTLSLPALTQANGVFSEGVLTLATTSAIQYEQLSAPSRLSELERLASDYSGKAVSVQVSAPERLHKTEAELKKEFASHPVIKSLTETFGASLIRCIPVEHTRS
ncbi:DNA polymerase III subunit gamma/tau [Bilophila wadsworthia]|uniref:DNA polymerase III subunit gamma/tau n=1 Tax=Bilophila wadsworthia TaxID=35833 RepID=UPI0026DB1D73|nr:DNA polymerase III subunit gamma/tau [Bilophila wadsworthia]